MKKILLTLAVMALGLAAYAQECSVVLIDQNGKEYPYQLLMPQGADGYSTLIKVYYGEKWGTTPYTTSVDEQGKVIVDIPNPLYVDFYYVIDGVKYYADKDGDTIADTSTADNNPLTDSKDYVYQVEVGYAWTFGLQLYKDGTWHAFVTKGSTAVNELNADKAVASTRYFNVAGQEMNEANGVTIVVTTYTDGTTSTSKVIK